MQKRIFLIVMVLGLCFAPLFLAEEKPMPEQVEPAPTVRPAGYTVVLNQYSPAEWNGGYGHYDLSFFAPENQVFQCKTGDDCVECRSITLSYGPTNGDNSQARVHLYTEVRSDHVPSEQLLVYKDLPLEAFQSFMTWFMEEFTQYSNAEERYHVFRVVEDGYDVYSLSDKRTCLSGALHMVLAIPGVKDEQKNPCASQIARWEADMQR